MICFGCKKTIEDNYIKKGGYWAAGEYYFHKDCKHHYDSWIYNMQLIDTNCNDCIHLERHNNKTSKTDIKSGYCNKKDIEVTFIQNHCMVDNQECFKHRK